MVQLANGDLSFVARRGWQHRWNDELWVDFVEFHLADPIRLWIQEQASRAADVSQRMMPPRCDLQR